MRGSILKTITQSLGGRTVEKIVDAPTVTEQLAEIAGWTKATFITALATGTILVAMSAYVLSEYIRLKNATIAAGEAIAKAAGERAKPPEKEIPKIRRPSDAARKQTEPVHKHRQPPLMNRDPSRRATTWA